MNNLNEQMQSLKAELLEATDALEHRNAQFEEIKSGVAGTVLGKGLGLTAITYVIAGARLTPETTPLAALGIGMPVLFWQIAYGITLLTATYLWYRPRNRFVYTVHWIIPTISLMLATVALLASGLLELYTGESNLKDEFLSSTGYLGAGLFTGYIAIAQYTFLRLSVLLKDGKPYD